MSRTGLALRALSLWIHGASADPTPDYDIASPTYDDYFTSVMGPHSVSLLDRVRISPGDAVVELACGTGHLTEEIVRRLDGRGRLAVVDKSPGMLAVARGKVAHRPGLELSFAEGDMEDFLRRQPTDSADLVVIGWAICYSQPVRLLRDVRRVLREGGQVAVIETRSTALSTLREAFEQVVADDPSMLTSLIRVSLPKSEQVLGKWFRKAGLDPVILDQGAQELPIASVAEAMDWVERSGAGAGFRDSFDISREEEIRARLGEALEEYRREHGALGLRHTFVLGVARHRVARATPGAASSGATEPRGTAPDAAAPDAAA
ncbi:Methyltransferase type 11 [Nostocoides japonicum T1-X7]|uniref:Methyltransferase type 11 n=1 Tax=Nostocoides japonicum T1-X7 TaxID=1194083 RepID=A0A077LWF8_9MICO|nr:class I SAM-dependent methyltransferase [Tetrasphaera japonica]CCH76344.1 Methyltransferase type 11 [Tetrasphaera japonica T1-X7]